MKRRDFLKTSDAAGTLTLINGRALTGESAFKQKDIGLKLDRKVVELLRNV